jgi:hypothetical protein
VCDLFESNAVSLHRKAVPKINSEKKFYNLQKYLKEEKKSLKA